MQNVRWYSKMNWNSLYELKKVIILHPSYTHNFPQPGIPPEPPIHKCYAQFFQRSTTPWIVSWRLTVYQSKKNEKNPTFLHLFSWMLSGQPLGKHPSLRVTGGGSLRSQWFSYRCPFLGKLQHQEKRLRWVLAWGSLRSLEQRKHRSENNKTPKITNIHDSTPNGLQKT